jgi:hypothetical protein
VSANRRSCRYFDPDGAAHEVILKRPGFADSEMLEPAVWTTVTLD